MEDNEQNIVPWTEKYRPGVLEDLVYQNDIIKLLQSSYSSNNLPHLLFHGPPGTGKTTSIIAICKYLYKTHFNSKVLELNASDDRGITVIRKKIKEFAKNSVRGSIPNYKVIILDEADFLTIDAQSALRCCIEEYSNITRFCIICNYINKIITPIQSRCAILYFKPIPNFIIKDRLEYIVNSEGKNLEENVIEYISNKSNGDLRKSINLLELICLLEEDIIDNVLIEKNIDTKIIENLLSYGKKKKIKSLAKYIKGLLQEGISGKMIINNILDYVVNNNKINTEQKAYMIKYISETECSIIDGNNEYIQLFELVRKINIE